MSKVDISIEKIKRILRKVVWFLGERAFMSFIIFVFMAIFICAAIFYYYVFLVESSEPNITIENIKLDENSYKSFLEIYKTRREKFINTDSKIYFNPFYEGQN
jgi:hypothetical protein